MTKKKQVGVRFDSNRTRLKTGETQRPNGTYAYRWSTPDGKRHSIYAPTLEKLREQEEQIIVDKHDGIRSDVKSITVNEMFDLWCQLKRGIKDSTFKNYIYMYIKVWWKCHLGHEWNTLISTRAGGSQCPYCSGIKLLKGFNDLKTKYPSLAAEWSEKNLPLTPDAVNEKSTKNVWWKCRTCGYEWKAVVKARVKGGMCPVCAERAVLQGYNDLGTTDPHLLSEWDYEKNSKWTPSNVSRNSMKVVWWKCGAGHSYRAKITDRTIEQKGCPQCEAEFQQALPQMLIMMYGAQNGITVKSNSDSELGMRLVAYLPELHCAVDIAGATVTEKREQSVKAHICQSNRLGYYLIKRTADASQMAAEIKTLFIRNHIYLHTDSEKDVQVLRERFLEWKYRNACKLNGKY